MSYPDSFGKYYSKNSTMLEKQEALEDKNATKTFPSKQVEK
jgi:hypothetical protein